MTYRKSDGPFGLLPKKTAMDLEWGGELFAVPAQREIDLRGHRGPEVEPPASRPAEGQSGARDSEAGRR